MFEQIIPWKMTITGATSYSAGAEFVASLDDVPTDLDGMLTHLVGVFFDIEYSPAFTTAPTIYGANNLVKTLTVSDGANPRLDLLGGFNGLRSHEIFETGDVLTPDPDLNGGTGNRLRIQRAWFCGPLGFEQRDFMLPVASLGNGEIRGKYGALTDISADTTAVTINRMTMIAMLALREGELRIPPMYERRTSQLNSSGQSLQGNGWYTHLGLTKTSYAAFAAGDISDVNIDTGRGVKGAASIPATVLDGLNQLNNRAGQFTKIRGEFSAASVDNEKTVNLASPTALTAADATHQSIFNSPPNSFITKIPIRGNNVRVNWTGTTTTVNAQYGRFLPQTPQSVSLMIQKACTRLNKTYIPGNTKVATFTKTTFSGDPSLMPFKYKLSNVKG